MINNLILSHKQLSNKYLLQHKQTRIEKNKQKKLLADSGSVEIRLLLKSYQ